MSSFERVARSLDLTPAELVIHIIHGHFTKDKEVEATIVEGVMTRYANYGTLPRYVTDYCERHDKPLMHKDVCV